MAESKRLHGKEWFQLRTTVLQRDGFRCKRCGRAGRMHVDHVKPLADGGTNALSNLQSLCYHCHRVKTRIEQAKPERAEWVERVTKHDA